MAASAAHAPRKASDLRDDIELFLIPVTQALPLRAIGIGSAGQAGKSGEHARIPAAQPLAVRNAQVQDVEAVADRADEAASSA